MAKDIPRKVVKQIVRDYQSGRLQSAPSQPQSPSKDNVFWVYNSTSSVINPGTLVQITGFAGLTTYAQAYQAMLNNRLAFVVTLPSSGSGSGATPTSLATSIDCISANSLNLGRVRYDGLTFILAHINNDTHTEISDTGESVASGGACVIVAKSPKNSSTNYAVCAVAKKTGGGGSGGTSESITYASAFSISNGNLVVTMTTKDVLVP